ncbi:hypothetical protein SBA4_2610009 [Candidatus Sulfopaludibacter sp. SbA4]|nr:hypothetical protein SBA4_2610009 [Candidatus Sulfopaludibacter sp. SbA4]
MASLTHLRFGEPNPQCCSLRAMSGLESPAASRPHSGNRFAEGSVHEGGLRVPLATLAGRALYGNLTPKQLYFWIAGPMMSIKHRGSGDRPEQEGLRTYQSGEEHWYTRSAQ